MKILGPNTSAYSIGRKLQTVTVATAGMLLLADCRNANNDEPNPSQPTFAEEDSLFEVESLMCQTGVRPGTALYASALIALRASKNSIP